MRIRGFEVVKDEARKSEGTVQLPTRADALSAGYDLYSPISITLQPMQKTIIFTDVKAYMLPDEVFEVYIRSSLAVKTGLMLSNNVGIIDSSYYNNPGNDGNIGIALVNTSGKDVIINSGDRIAQGIFKNFLVADGDKCITSERVGGFGSSGK